MGDRVVGINTRSLVGLRRRNTRSVLVAAAVVAAVVTPLATGGGGAGATVIAGANNLVRHGQRAVPEAEGAHHRHPPARLQRLPRQPRGSRPEHLRQVRRRRRLPRQGDPRPPGAVRRPPGDPHGRRQHRRVAAGQRPLLRGAGDDRHELHERRLRLGRQPRVRQGQRRTAADPERWLSRRRAARRRRTLSPTGPRRTRFPAPTSSTCRPTSSSTPPARPCSRPTAPSASSPTAARSSRSASSASVLEGTPTIVTPTGVAGLTFEDEADGRQPRRGRAGSPDA